MRPKRVFTNHDPADLIRIFDALFRESHNTVLVRGDAEPLYVPSTESRPAEIVFAHGFFASALHEIAHWCIAGERRRELKDYGYWYQPDGRTPAEQSEFLKAETRPQALERMFSAAAGFPFHLSLDNLGGDPGDVATFAHTVMDRIQRYTDEGLPPRAEQFFLALRQFFAPSHIDFHFDL